MVEHVRRKHKKKGIHMVIIKCILGAVIGAIGGIVAAFVAAMVVWIVVGIVTWDSESGEAAANWAVLCLPAGILIGIIFPIILEIDTRRQTAKSEQDALEAERRILSNLLTNSKSTFLTLPELVGAADSHLDKAEREFSEGAFAPFWDEVEHATNKLGAYHDGVTSINKHAKEYYFRRSKLSISIPEFSMPKEGLPDARPVAARLSKIVRNGQKDFQFATIYEQRKTNQLLYAGFGTLAAGIERMQYAITDALDNLSGSLGRRLDDLLSTSRAQADLISTLTEHVTSSADVQRQHEKDSLSEKKRQNEMLDNIQRDRKPFP